MTSKETKILITIIAAAAVVTGFVYAEKSRQRQASPQAQKQNDQQTDETANWKTYRNEEYGFELKYPGDWRLRESDTTFVGRNDYDMLSIFMEKTGFRLAEDWFKAQYSNREQGYIPRTNSITIAGVSGLRYADPLSIGGCLEEYVFIKDKILYKLTRGPVTCDLKKETFNQILATFKFIE